MGAQPAPRRVVLRLRPSRLPLRHWMWRIRGLLRLRPLLQYGSPHLRARQAMAGRRLPARLRPAPPLRALRQRPRAQRQGRRRCLRRHAQHWIAPPRLPLRPVPLLHRLTMGRASVASPSPTRRAASRLSTMTPPCYGASCWAQGGVLSRPSRVRQVRGSTTPSPTQSSSCACCLLTPTLPRRSTRSSSTSARANSAESVPLRCCRAPLALREQ